MKNLAIAFFVGIGSTLALIIVAVMLTTDSTAPAANTTPKPQQAQTVAAAPKEEPAAPPLTEDEMLKEAFVYNTPGIIAKEAAMAVSAEDLSKILIPATCDVLEAFPLASTAKVIVADAAFKKWGTDEKASANVAEGILKTAIDSGRCDI